MTALTEAEISGEKCRDVLSPERKHLRSNFREKLLDESAGIAPQPDTKSQLGFGNRWSSHCDHPRIAELPQQPIDTLFIADQSDDCRRVEDQTGSPDAP